MVSCNAAVEGEPVADEQAGGVNLASPCTRLSISRLKLVRNVIEMFSKELI